MENTSVTTSLPKVNAEMGSQRPREEKLSLLETVSRFGAFSIAVTYAAGFLIIASHGSRFGIVEFSPFRPRIFAAGALFALLVAVPVLAVSRVFHFFDLRNPSAVSITVRHENLRFFRLSLAFDFYFACFGLCFFSLVLFPPGFIEPKPWGFTLVLMVIALFASTMIVQQKHFDLRPLSSTLLSFLSASALALVAFSFWGRTHFWLSVWYYFVGIATVYLHGVFEDRQRQKELEWEKAILYFVGMVLAFATGIYSRINPSLGGGSPIPAVVHLTAIAPVSSSKSVSVLVVSENEFGYFVLKPGQETPTYFLRRDLVSAIEFGKKK